MGRGSSLVMIILAVLLAPALAGFEPPADSDRWTRVSVGQFEVMTDLGEEETSRIGGLVHRMTAAVDQATLLNTASVKPVSIFVFSRPAEFESYKHAVIGDISARGLYASRRFGDYIVMTEANGGHSSVLFHELTHFFSRNTFDTVPLWLSEGMAGVFQSLELKDDHIILGVPDRRAIRLLRQTPPVPMAEILAMTGFAEDYSGGARQRLVYAQSWAMVHQILIGDREMRRRLPKYFDLLLFGESQVAAFEKAFDMTPEAFEKELFSYVRRPTMKQLRVDVEGGPEAELDVVAMSRSEIIGELGALLADSSRSSASAAERFLKESIRLDADNATAHAALGTLLQSRGEHDEAHRHLEQAIAADPDDFRAGVARARVQHPTMRTVTVLEKTSSSPPPEMARAIEEAHRQAIADLEAASTPEERERLQKIIDATRRPTSGENPKDLYERAIELANAQKIEEALDLIETILTTTQERSMMHMAAVELKRQILQQTQ